MTTGIKDWSTTAASNNAAPPNGFPEGMAPASLNDSSRQVMAEVRAWYEDPFWIDFGNTPSQTGANTFTVATDLTARYATGRRIRMKGTTPFTLYGTILSSSYSAPNTTVTVTMDSGSLDSTLNEIALNAASLGNTGIAILGADNTFTGANTFSGVTTFSTRVNTAKGADIASASTVNIGAATGNYIDITGTTTITAFDSVTAGAIRVLKFEGILTLTHNATSLILPTGADITTAVGDVAVFVSEGSGNWRCVSYSRANGQALSQPPSDGQAKAWAYVTWSGGTPTLEDSFNVSGITDLGAGNLRVTFTTPFATANYATNVTPRDSSAAFFSQVQTQATGSIDLFIFQYSTGNATDPTALSVVCFGDQ